MVENKKTGAPRWELTQRHDVLDEVDLGVFEIGLDHDEGPCKSLVCRKCGGDKFQMGWAAYTVVARCPTCGWECEVHSG
jgi:hypothetical protein